MADDDGDAPKKVQVDPAEVLSAWFKARVVSSFKCKPEQADTMINNETSRVAIDTFFNNETCQRLLVFASPDLTAVRATRTPGSGVRRGRPDPPDLTTDFFLFPLLSGSSLRARRVAHLHVSPRAHTSHHRLSLLAGHKPSR